MLHAKVLYLCSSVKFHTDLHLLSLLPDSPICRNAGDACPVRRNFGDLAFPQGEELIPHIDALRRILPGVSGYLLPEGIRQLPFPFG
jgi:hypothetical protein